MTIYPATGRIAAEQLAARLRDEGEYALARFRPELGGWHVLVRGWA